MFTIKNISRPTRYMHNGLDWSGINELQWIKLNWNMDWIELNAMTMDWNNKEQYGMVRNSFFMKQVHTGAVCIKPGANFVKFRCASFLKKISFIVVGSF